MTPENPGSQLGVRTEKHVQAIAVAVAALRDGCSWEEAAQAAEEVLAEDD